MRNAEKNKIDNDVLETLDLLEDLPKNKVRYGFYQRLNYRIEHPDEAIQKLHISPFARALRFVGTPALAAACIVLGIFVGLDTSEKSTNSDLDVLVDTYSLSISESPQLLDTESDQ